MINWALKLFFLLLFQYSFSQQQLLENFTSKAKYVEIITKGLDDLVIENSEDNNFKVTLYNNNSFPIHIVKEEQEAVQTISFERILHLGSNPKVFRKYITTMLERVRAVIKIPKHKKINIHGNTVGIISKSYEGDLSISIEKGHINLNEVKKDVTLKLFQGNVYLTTKDSNLDISTSIGNIVVNKVIKTSPFKQQKSSFKKDIIISSIRANIFIN